MHGIMSISELGTDGLRAASRIILKSESGVRAGIRTQSVGSTAVIPIFGVFLRRQGTYAPYIVDVDEARDAVNAAASDQKVREIVLLIDSPGGTVEGLHELGQAVHSAAKSKPVTAQVDGMSASAAYYVASQATEIIAGPSDLIGSIGTILMVYDWSKMFDEAGVRVVPITSGPFKATGQQGTPLTPEQEGYLQGIVDAYFADFKAVIKRGRKMNDKAIEAVADGRVFTSKAALDAGLIDRIVSADRTLSGFADRSRARAQQSFIDSLSLDTRK